MYYTRHFFVCQEVFRKKFNRLILYLRRRRILEGIRTALGRIDKDRSVFAWSGIGRCRIFFKSILDKVY